MQDEKRAEWLPEVAPFRKSERKRKLGEPIYRVPVTAASTASAGP